MASDAVPAAETSAVPCISCRSRRVKCDKRLPGCVRCEKSSKPCPGYNRVRSFHDLGASLREKYPDQTPQKPKPQQRSGPSIQSILHSAAPQSTQGEASSSPAGGLSREEAAVPVQQTSPSAIHSVSATPTLTDTARTEGSVANSDQGTTSSVNGMDKLSDADFDAIFFDIDSDVYYAQWNNCCGWIPNAHLINDADDSLAPTTLSWYTPINSGATPDSAARALPEESEKCSEGQAGHDENDGDHHETAHLIQHFSQHISPCLDVFDIQRYFGHSVPVRALESTLLRNLLAALSAKQFAKTRREGAVAVTSLIPTSKWTPAPSCLDQFYGHIPNSEWYYRAASFYDKAITQMMGLLQSLRSGTLTSEPTSTRGTPTSSGSPRDMGRLLSAAPSPTKRRRTDQRELQHKRALDDLLAAVSIFLLYESLDNHQIEILSHMTGAQYLLQEHLPGRASGTEGPFRSFDTSQAWRASFWNVAMIDYTQAYTDRTSPRLNTQDQHLWKAAGIPLRSVNNILVPESLCGIGDDASEPPPEMTETVACRTLIWIILRALGYAAAEKNNFQALEKSQNSTAGNSLGFGPESWHMIRQHLIDWEESVPDTFRPFATLPRPGQQALTASRPIPSNSSATSDDKVVTVPFPTLCYSSFMASTASILYHFIQIFLLLHRPLEPTSGSFSHFASRRLAAYRQLSQEVDEHAEKICSICLGQQPGNDASQMHMAQPLHLAGLSFEGHEQRFVLEGLLKGIQRGSGWSTEWIVTSLRGEWGWDAVAPRGAT